MVSYDLDDSTVRERTATAFARHPELPGQFIGLAISADDPLADVARTVERQVFEGTFGNGTSTMYAEYESYEHDSLFVLVLDRHTGLPAGAGRVIDGGTKTFDDAPGLIGRDLAEIIDMHGMQDGRIWEIATLAVLPHYRGGRSALEVSTLLYRTFINAGVRAQVRHLVAMLDFRAHRNLMLIGAPFVPLAGSGPFAYLGSPSTRALYAAFDTVKPSIERQSERLRQFGAQFNGEIRSRGLRRLLTRRIAARVATRIASGRGLDERIELPALERRRSGRRGFVLDRRHPGGGDRRRASVAFTGGVDRRSPTSVDRRRSPGSGDRRTGNSPDRRAAPRRGRR